MKPNVVFLLIIFIAFPFITEATEWISYATTEKGTELYFDKESISRESDHLIRARDKSKYDRPLKVANQSYSELWRYLELDCKEKKLRVFEVIFFLVSGDTRTVTGKQKEGWVRIKPGENNDNLRKMLCEDALDKTNGQTIQQQNR